LKRNIITTGDGSKTIQIEEWDEQYHSVHGAINEANHVFIKQGLSFFSEQFLEDSNNISILEIGFGTALNAFITAVEAEKRQLNINYVGVEGYPVVPEEYLQLNYAELISKEHSEMFTMLHEVAWEIPNVITSNFSLEKRQLFFSEKKDHNQIDLIYFDALGARLQPELWTEAIFEIMFMALKTQGVLVTYSAKGSVRRAMQSVGFTVERLPGPPGKREMLRAVKGAEHSAIQ
jgi:tRNA U34 5-methylaminomethyl-2-thiouridine-forming methyltransferase MnmC